MEILNKRLSIEEFKAYVSKKNFGSVPPNSLVIHHTFSPTEKQWSGQRNINGLKAYYESKGWSAGPHLFIGEDGIWLFTDMSEVGIHAGTGNATWKDKKTGTIWKGYGEDFEKNTLLECSIGIEVVGNYDSKVWQGKTKENTIQAILALCDTLKIKKEKIYFHRDFQPKSCPGTAITKAWLIKELDKVAGTTTPIKEDYVANFRKLFKLVSEFVGKDYGSNPGDKDIEDIRKELESRK